MTVRAGAWALSGGGADRIGSPRAIVLSILAHAALAVVLAWVGARTLDQPAPPQAIEIVLDAVPASRVLPKPVPARPPPPAEASGIPPPEAPAVPPEAAPLLMPISPEPEAPIPTAPRASPSVAAPVPPVLAVVIPEEPRAPALVEAHPAPKPAPPRVASDLQPVPSRPGAPRKALASPAPAAPSPPAPAAPAPPAAPAQPASAPSISPSWRGAIGAWLEAHKVYPEAARRRGEEGVVAMRFTVDRSGQVLDGVVEHGSGSDLLDRAVRTMLQGARLPAFPASMTQDQVTLSVPVRFRLE